MTIYLDLEIILNFCYDFLLLITLDMTLKRHGKLRRLIFSAIFGSLSIFLLLLPLNNFVLFILKILASIIMVLVAYGYKDVKYTFNNILYLYMESVILGGFLYFLNIAFSYKNTGLIFFHHGLSINYILLLIIAPVILGIYIYQNKRIKNFYNYLYEVKIVLKNKEEVKCQGFIDTGNHLKDPITNKFIILVEPNLLKINESYPIYVPYRTIEKRGILECFSIDYIEVNKQKFKNYLVGIALEKFNMEGCKCLLNNRLLEDICFEN